MNKSYINKLNKKLQKHQLCCIIYKIHETIRKSVWRIQIREKKFSYLHGVYYHRNKVFTFIYLVQNFQEESIVVLGVFVCYSCNFKLSTIKFQIIKKYYHTTYFYNINIYILVLKSDLLQCFVTII